MDNQLPKTIGMPAKNALEFIGVTTLDQVANYSEEELLQIHGVGPKAVKILKELLKENNLSLKI